MCAIQRVNGQDKILKCLFELGMVVGTGLCQELQRYWVLHTQQFPVCIKNGPPAKGHPANLTQLFGSIGVNMDQHPCETHSTP